MALSLRDKLAQAAKANMAAKATATVEKLQEMETAPPANGKAPVVQIRQEDATPYGAPAPEITESHKAPRPNKKKVTPGHTGSDLVNPGQTTTDQVTPDQTRIDHLVKPGVIWSGQVTPCQTRSDQTAPLEQHTRSNQVRPGQTRLTRQERAALGYIEEIRERVVPAKAMARSLAMPVPTLYKIIRRLRDRGHILAAKEGNDGTYLKFIGWNVVRPGQTKQPPLSNTQSQTRSDQVRPGEAGSVPSLDRKIENLSISLEAIRTAWPHLARAGFGPEQVEQIVATLAQLGKPADRIVQGLDHAEWELAAGKMLDKEGRAVADPCAWVFRCLAGQGYYRRPAGFVSAQEQAERDAAEEAKALAKAREETREARFQAWRRGLTSEERETVLAGRQGPEEAWLKNVWVKRGEPI